MFHNFPNEPKSDCLVRSTDFTFSDQQVPTDLANPIYTLYAISNSNYEIFVTDRSQDVIWVYDNAGNLINKPGVLERPKGVAIIP